MDMSLVMAAMTAKAGALQNNIAMQVMKNNFSAQKDAVDTLLGISGGGSSQANLSAGVGGTVDRTA